jgi:hypothetical protein
MINEFLEFVAAYDRQFPSVIRGASADSIARLQSLVRTPLPGGYREFLSRMGENDGDLRIAFLGTTNVRRIIEYYAEVGRGESDPPPANCILIGTGDISAGDVCLETRNVGEARVVRVLDAEIEGLYAESLEKLLYRTAFLKYEFERRARAGFYIGQQSADFVASATQAAMAAGYRAEWFSDAVVFCGRRDDIVLNITQYEGSPGAIIIGGGTAEQVEAAGKVFEDAGLARFDQWSK